MQDKQFWKNGLCFSCTQCSACCRFEPGLVYLTEKDLAGLVQWAMLSKDSFINQFCRWVLQNDGYEYLCLKERANYDCILWNEGCIAYEFRPIQCSSYPFWDCLLHSKGAWELNAQSCPGINRGKLYSGAEIHAFLDESDKNLVIKRKK